MAVVIEELHAEVASTPAPPPAASAPAAASMDEHKVMEMIALEHWHARRLAAD